NEDGFVGATRAVFERTQVDYQNDLRPVSWLTLTSGFYYSRINAGQERPFVLFGPTFVSDHTDEIAGFVEATLTPVENSSFVDAGLTYFHNDLSNVIGFNGLFDTLNLGSAETQGLEAELRAQPIPNFVLTAAYTYLEAEKTSSKDVSQLQGARLPRRPRNEVY